MNENAKAWVEALRSGEYKQGRGGLCNVDNEFCCMGVACDVFIKAGGELTVAHGNMFIQYDDYLGFMPEKVANWLGLRPEMEADPIIRPAGKLSFTLSDANDVRLMTFPEIADLIETNQEELFV